MKTSRRSLPYTAAVGLIAVLGLTACESDPSAKRVAQDLVKTLTQDEPEVQECMLDVIDGYTTSELQDIGNDSLDGDAAAKVEADATLVKFEADLAACRT
ncbi:MAG: hypothetical protein WBP59_07190 [Ilumatobacteraceae bacterium]